MTPAEMDIYEVSVKHFSRLMDEYFKNRRMYKTLFRAQVKAMKIMEKAHEDAEEMFISAPEPDIRLLDFKKTEDEDDS